MAGLLTGSGLRRTPLPLRPELVRGLDDLAHPSGLGNLDLRGLFILEPAQQLLTQVRVTVDQPAQDGVLLGPRQPDDQRFSRGGETGGQLLQTGPHRRLRGILVQQFGLDTTQPGQVQQPQITRRQVGASRDDRRKETAGVDILLVVLVLATSMTMWSPTVHALAASVTQY